MDSTEREAFNDLVNEILAPNADHDMADSGSAEATDCSMLPTAATIDPEQIRKLILKAYSKARDEGMRQVFVIRGKDLAAFSRHASPGDACIVVGKLGSRLHRKFRPRRHGTPNEVGPAERGRKSL
jgi:hypothetical protein